MNQAKIAKTLLAQRDEGSSLFKSLRRSWRRILFRILLIAIALFLYFNVDDNILFILAVGMFLGAFLQDIGWFMSIGKTWPFTESIINWSKVEEIAKDDS